MRWVIWFLMIFVASVVAVLYAGNSTAFVSFFMTDTRYDIRFNFFVILLVCLFVIGYFLLRLISNLFRLPARFGQHAQSRRTRRSHEELSRATIQLLAGQYTRARKNANKALKNYTKNIHTNSQPSSSAEHGILSHLALAGAAQKLGDQQTRNEQLAKALKLADLCTLTEAADAIRLQQIQWMIDDQDMVGAHQALDQLDPTVAKRIPTLQMRLQVNRLEGSPLAALETVRQLVKHKAYTALQAEQSVAESAGKLLDSALDERQLESAWNQLNHKEQHMPAVSAYAAMRFAKFNNPKQACDLITNCWTELASLSEKARLALLYTLDQILPHTDPSWINRIEEAVRFSPTDPILAYLAGRIYALNQFEHKAQPLLEKASKDEQLPATFRQKAWLELAHLAESQQDQVQANLCYKAAATLPS